MQDVMGINMILGPAVTVGTPFWKSETITAANAVTGSNGILQDA